MTTAKEALVGTNLPRMYIDTTTCVPRPRFGLVMFSIYNRHESRTVVSGPKED